MAYWCCGERISDFFEAMSLARKKLASSPTDVTVHELEPDSEHPGVETSKVIAILRKMQLRSVERKPDASSASQPLGSEA